MKVPEFDSRFSSALDPVLVPIGSTPFSSEFSKSSSVCFKIICLVRSPLNLYDLSQNWQENSVWSSPIKKINHYNYW